VKPLSSHEVPFSTTRTAPIGAIGGMDGGGGGDGGDGGDGGAGGGVDGGGGVGGGDGGAGGGDMSPVHTQTFSLVQFPPTALNRTWSPRPQ